DITLHGAQVAVLGYGRVGRALASRLAALGADVCVAVRKKVDMTRISCDGYRPLMMTGEGLSALCDGYDVIFNTVPARIVSEDLLTRLSKETLLIELASCPGGWSSEEAARLGHRVIYAPGLPAKYAPRTAGRLIAEVLCSYLTDKEGGTL
ncbi:MAG: NAD(P)-binding domain-containing protein, partial [Clostridia bacterium]|nr:NAD(P)-binding domain-containing protein [Clostridia bacterium]